MRLVRRRGTRTRRQVLFPLTQSGASEYVSAPQCRLVSGAVKDHVTSLRQDAERALSTAILQLSG